MEHILELARQLGFHHGAQLNTAALDSHISVLEQGGYLAEDELVGAKKVLKAAAMTYVVALLTSLWQMFRYILIIFNGRSRR